MPVNRFISIAVICAALAVAAACAPSPAAEPVTHTQGSELYSPTASFPPIESPTTPEDTPTPSQTPTAGPTPAEPAMVAQTDEFYAVNNSIAVSPDGRTLAMIGKMGLYLYDLPGVTERSAPRTREWLFGVAFFPDGRYLAAGAWDASVILYDAQTGGLIRRLERHPNLGAVPADDPFHSIGVYPSTPVAVSPDGSWIASRRWNQAVYLWNSETGEPVRKMQEFFGRVEQIKFSPDGSLLAASAGERIILWNPTNGKKLAALKHDTGINSFAFSPDGRWLASGDHGGEIRIWDVSDFGVERAMQSRLRVFSLDFSPDGKFLATAVSGWLGGEDRNDVELWEAGNGEKIISYTLLCHALKGILFLPDGKTLLVRSERGLWIWDASYWMNG